nr:11299_t:CDS:10 [Entrophospora candida]
MDNTCIKAIIALTIGYLGLVGMILGYKVKFDKKGAQLEKNDQKGEKDHQENKKEISELKKDKSELKDLVIKLQERIINFEKEGVYSELSQKSKPVNSGVPTPPPPPKKSEPKKSNQKGEILISKIDEIRKSTFKLLDIKELIKEGGSLDKDLDIAILEEPTQESAEHNNKYLEEQAVNYIHNVVIPDLAKKEAEKGDMVAEGYEKASEKEKEQFKDKIQEKFPNSRGLTPKRRLMKNEAAQARHKLNHEAIQAKLQLERDLILKEVQYEEDLNKMETGITQTNLDNANNKFDFLNSFKQKGEELLKDKVNEVKEKLNLSKEKDKKKPVIVNGKELYGAFTYTKFFCPISQKKVRDKMLAETEEKFLIVDCMNGDFSYKDEKQSKPEKLTSPKTPKFPLHSPTTPNTPEKVNSLNFSPLPKEEDFGNVLDELINKNKGYSKKILNKLLEEKEREIEHSQNQEIDRLKSEVKECGDDYYQLGLEKDKLKQLLQQERSEKQELTQRLESEVNENCRLKENQEKINASLLTKQAEEYEQENQERERRHSEQMDNLRKFQSQEVVKPIPKSLSLKQQHTKSYSYSSPSSVRSSYVIEGDLMIFTSPPLQADFSSELNRQGYQERSGIISPEFTTEPKSEEKKRRSDSPFFVSSPTQEEEIRIENALADLESEVSYQTENAQGMLEENERLKEQLAQSEAAYQVLSDNQIAIKQETQTALTVNEELINQINQQRLEGEVQQKYLQQEIDELKYRLAESQKKVSDIEKSEKKFRYQLKEKQQEVEGLSQDLVKISQRVDEDEIRENNLEQATNKLEQSTQREEKIENLNNKINAQEQFISEMETELERAIELLEELRKERDLLKEKKEKSDEEGVKIDNSLTKAEDSIGGKEKELEDWQSKLEACQKERNQIRKEIQEKVSELEVSQLSNSEKQEKINKLLTEHSNELEEIDKLLYDERAQYRNIRDKVINELCRPCRAYYYSPLKPYCVNCENKGISGEEYRFCSTEKNPFPIFEEDV